MANLAIRGHETRGKEVIEILEMLGGENEQCFHGGDTDAIYYIGNNKHIWVGIECYFCADFFYKITLEEFLEKFPYKVGDFVRVPEYDSKVCICKMRWNSIYNYMEYLVNRDDTPEWYTARALLDYNDDFLVDKETNMNEDNKDVDDVRHVNSITDDIMINQITSKVSVIKFNPDVCDNEIELQLGNYKIEVRDGKTYAVKKKPLFPKTYKDCCEVLMGKTDFQDYSLVLTKLSTNKNEENSISPEPPHITLINNYYKLLICRNAYWKIAGKEMGLGKPWNLDYDDRIFIICNDSGHVHTYEYHGSSNVILAFPTKEMRDAFYENFKDLIETCKELL